MQVSRLDVAKQGCYSKTSLTSVTQKQFIIIWSSYVFMSCLVKRAFKNQDSLPDANSIYLSAQLHAPQDQRKMQVYI